MKRHVTLIAIGVVCVALLFFTLWGLRMGRSAQHVTVTSSFSRDPSITREMPSSKIPTNPNFQSSDTAAVSTATPPLALIRDEMNEHRAIASDPQTLVVKQMLRDYRAALGENPTGTNSEIAKALLGANSRKARFVAEEAKLNSAHQLVDRWNHPYFFHQLSRAHMEIRSAGPDGVLWTSDDELSP